MSEMQADTKDSVLFILRVWREEIDVCVRDVPCMLQFNQGCHSYL